jgi:hypothetical protein
VKIIGTNTHDYYDAVRVHGHDETGHIFLRNSEIVFAKPNGRWLTRNVGIATKVNHALDFMFEGLLIGADTSHYSMAPNFDVTVNKIRHQFTLGYRRVLFCGKLYTSIKVHRSSTGVSSDPSFKSFDYNYFYTIESLQHYLENYEINLKKEKSDTRNWRKPQLSIENISKNLTVSDTHFNHCVENKLVIAITVPEPGGSNAIVELNGELKKVQFYKVFDAFTAYQELAMYVDGYLAYPGNQMIEIENEFRVKAHGFDHKYAFRKLPEK